MTLYDKQCKGQFLEKYNTKGNLVRTAEQFESGSWIVSDFDTKKRLSGEYTETEFKNIKKHFKN